MKQEEAIGVCLAESQVQIQDPLGRRRDDRFVVVARRRRRVDEVAQDGEVDARIEVAVREHFEVLEQPGHIVETREERRHDDHRAGVVGHAVGEIEPGQPARAERPRPMSRCTKAIARSRAGSTSSASAPAA